MNNIHPLMAAAKNGHPSVERLREIFECDPSTGVLTRKVFSGGQLPGTRAGCLSRGYVLVSVDGKLLRAHRVVWAICHGEWPKGEIDHINRIKSDNRISNLRDVSSHLNRHNQVSAHKDSRTGLRGVSMKRSKFHARISAGQTSLSLGVFDDPQTAHEAYLNAKKELHMGALLDAESQTSEEAEQVHIAADLARNVAKPKGRSFTTTLGDSIPIEVFYDYSPPEAAVYDLDSPMCGPGCPADVDICEVMLMGEDVRDLLADHFIESLEEQALERHES